MFNGCKVLFHGQRKARKHHECEHCERSIERSEFYYTKVVLYIDEDENKVVTQRKSCCKAI